MQLSRQRTLDVLGRVGFEEAILGLDAESGVVGQIGCACLKEICRADRWNLHLGAGGFDLINFGMC